MPRLLSMRALEVASSAMPCSCRSTSAASAIDPADASATLHQTLEVERTKPLDVLAFIIDACRYMNIEDFYFSVCLQFVLYTCSSVLKYVVCNLFDSNCLELYKARNFDSGHYCIWGFC